MNASGIVQITGSQWEIPAGSDANIFIAYLDISIELSTVLNRVLELEISAQTSAGLSVVGANPRIREILLPGSLFTISRAQDYFAVVFEVTSPGSAQTFNFEVQNNSSDISLGSIQVSVYVAPAFQT